MWYDNGRGLNYSKPIFAKKEHDTYLLVPQKEVPGSYTVIGYDWLNVKTGEFNSCSCYESAEESVKTYEGMGFTIFNKDI